jgi:hypothetical protein
MEDINDRIRIANEFVKIIAAHGRQFFHCKGTIGWFYVKRGHVYWVCEYSGKHIYLSYRYWTFHHGGTLRSLVSSLANFIRGNGSLPVNHLGPWPDHICEGDLWGYGKDEMQKVRDKCNALIQPAAEAAQ